MTLKLAIVIFAKDEANNIGPFLNALATQTLFDCVDVDSKIYVAANGCSDRTAQIARETVVAVFDSRGVRYEILDWPTPGKSRSWNRLIHEVLPTDLDYIMAVDPDIAFVNSSILAALIKRISEEPTLKVVSGFPVKDVTAKARPSLMDRFSLSVSSSTRHTGAINGSLYVAKAPCLREIWLPDETPGEDGFLNAMVATSGFSRPGQIDIVYQFTEPTHYFKSHSAANFFAHEKRMIVGTMINRWIFEYLHSLKLSEPAGPLIRRLNREEPDWVDRIITKRSAASWLIPGALLFRRLEPKHGWNASYFVRLPMLILATALTLPPAIMANQALKKQGAASTW